MSNGFKLKSVNHFSIEPKVIKYGFERPEPNRKFIRPDWIDFFIESSSIILNDIMISINLLLARCEECWRYRPDSPRDSPTSS